MTDKIEKSEIESNAKETDLNAIQASAGAGDADLNQDLAAEGDAPFESPGASDVDEVANTPEPAPIAPETEARVPVAKSEEAAADSDVEEHIGGYGVRKCIGDKIGMNTTEKDYFSEMKDAQNLGFKELLQRRMKM